MIQRLQTVFLTLATAVNGASIFTPLAGRAMQDPQGWIGILYLGLLAISLTLSLYAIFLYSNRRKQMKWVRFAGLGQAGSIAVGGAIAFSLGGIGTFMIQELLSLLLLVVAAFSLWQAHRLIRKDQELVDSMNRIR